jgi:hypothetical protein
VFSLHGNLTARKVSGSGLRSALLPVVPIKPEKLSIGVQRCPALSSRGIPKPFAINKNMHFHWAFEKSALNCGL